MVEVSELNHCIDELVSALGTLRGHLRRLAEFNGLDEFEMKEENYKTIERAIRAIKVVDSRAKASLTKVERRAYLKNIGKRHFPTGSSRSALGRK